MEEIWKEIAKGIGQVGAVGFFVLAYIAVNKYFENKNPKPVAVLARDKEEEREIKTPTDNEMRDMVRDTDNRTVKIERNTEQELSHLASIVSGLTRLGDTMDRMDERMEKHDSWEHSRTQMLEEALNLVRTARMPSKRKR